jgi:hypothetical protein
MTAGEWLAVSWRTLTAVTGGRYLPDESGGLGPARLSSAAEVI